MVQGLNLQRQTAFGLRNQVGIYQHIRVMDRRTQVDLKMIFVTTLEILNPRRHDSLPITSSSHLISRERRFIWIQMEEEASTIKHICRNHQPLGSERFVSKNYKISIFFQMLCLAMSTPKGIAGKSLRKKRTLQDSQRRRSQQ